MMNTIQLQTKAWFGDETLRISFPDSWQLVEAGPPEEQALTPHQMRESLARPIGTPKLSELAGTRTKAAIVIDDLTRPTPTADLLPLLIEELKGGGIDEQAVTIIVAGGTHPPASAEDSAKKIGPNVSPKVRVIAHDCYGELTDLGISPAGLPLKVNRTLMGCDLKIGVGCIYPHPFAGYSGGAKIVLPAVCGADTTREMHDYLRGARTRGGSIHTEVRRDMIAVARKVGLDFIANVTLNCRREISGLFAGDVEQAHEAGVHAAQRTYAVTAPSHADVVVADMYPFDGSWQFAQDRGMWPIQCAPRGATKVVIAACPQGLGTHELYPVASPFWSRIARRLRHLSVDDLRRRAEKLRTILKLIRQKREPLLVLAPGLQPTELKRVFPRATWFGEWSALLAALQARHGNGAVTVAVYRCAPLLIPSGTEERQGSCAAVRHPSRPSAQA